jgi:hypothetical protein
VLLFALNAYVCLKLFRVEYLDQMGSIEAAFIALARYARDNWRDLTWFPFWYNGIPYQNTYSPFLPMLVTGVSSLTGWTPALAYHATVATLYCAGPVALFWVCYRMSRRLSYSFFAGLMYSCVASSAFLIPDVRRDLGSLLRPRRLQTLVVYGEGPHVTGLLLLALSILLLDIAIDKRRPQYYVLAALAFAGTALTNWLAAASLAIAVLAYLLACSPVPARRRVLVVAGVGVLAYALAAPWIPPSTIRTFQFNSQTVEGDYRGYEHLLPLRVLALIAALAIVRFGLSKYAISEVRSRIRHSDVGRAPGLRRAPSPPARRRAEGPPQGTALPHFPKPYVTELPKQDTKLRAARTLQFGAYFTLITGAIALTWAYTGIFVVPQPHRYHTEMEMGLAVLLPFTLQPLLKRAPRFVRIGAACLAIAVAIPFIREGRRYARSIVNPLDITKRIEYRSARWIDANLRGQRVLMPGSTMFWLNAFTGTAQLGGGDAQGVTNFEIRVAEYVIEIETGGPAGPREAEVSLMWLKALGVDAVEVGGANSGEVFKPFRNPAKFAGVLPEIWRSGDDAIYAIPRLRASLAHVLRAADLPARTPIHGLDIDPLRPYVAALEDPAFPAADLHWTSRHSAQIQANLKPDQVVSVQVTYHPGWRASVNGRAAALRADALGQMVVEPGCDGPCAIELQYDGGAEMRLARMVCWMALAGSALWIMAGNYRRRSAST